MYGVEWVVVVDITFVSCQVFAQYIKCCVGWNVSVHGDHISSKQVGIGWELKL